MRRTWLAPLIPMLGLYGAPAAPVLAQGQRGTDIYLAALRTTPDGMRFGQPVNITDRDGYDNQPSFSPDGSFVLYTSNRGGQTDIYRFDIVSGSTTRVTHTEPESEYSATVTSHGNAFSAVRVEADSTQRLWEFGIDGRNPRLIFADVAPVGYHAWGSATLAALFVLGNPPTLQLADRSTGQSEIVAYNIGRSMHKIPGRDAVSFTHRVADGLVIKELDLTTQAVRPLVRLLEGNEFYAWMPRGRIIMGLGAKLFVADPSRDSAWEEVADFSASGMAEISRIAVSPQGDRLAVVAIRTGPA